MTEQAKMTEFFKFNDLDSRIAITVATEEMPARVIAHLAQRVIVTLAFMSKGNCPADKNGVRRKRNPERTPALDRLFAALTDVGGHPSRVRFGKTAELPRFVGKTSEARKSYSKGGNYRFDVRFVLRPGSPSSVAAFADHFGLVPCENRPVDGVNWLDME